MSDSEPIYPARADLRRYLDTVFDALRRLIPDPKTRGMARDLLERAADPLGAGEGQWHEATYDDIARGRGKPRTAMRLVGFLRAQRLLQRVKRQRGPNDPYNLPNRYRTLYRADIVSERMTFFDWRAKREPIDHGLPRRDRLANAQIRASQSVTGHHHHSDRHVVTAVTRYSTTYDAVTKPDVPEQENVLPFASGTGVGPKGRPIPTDPDPAPAGDHAGAGERDGEPGISVDDFVRFMAAQPDPPADESEEALHERMREQEPALRAAERAIARRAQRARDIYTFEALSPDWKGE